MASAGLTPVYDAARYADFMAGIQGQFPGAVQGILQANLAECVAMARDGNTLPQIEAEVTLCCMLANSTYESLPKTTRTTLRDEPVFEFFRHVRNAASHGNRWHFFPREPAQPARWDPVGGAPIAIDRTLLGNANPLHGKQCFYGTLQPADLLYLLRDVENIVVGLSGKP